MRLSSTYVLLNAHLSLDDAQASFNLLRKLKHNEMAVNVLQNLLAVCGSRNSDPEATSRVFSIANPSDSTVLASFCR